MWKSLLLATFLLVFPPVYGQGGFTSCSSTPKTMLSGVTFVMYGNVTNGAMGTVCFDMTTSNNVIIEGKKC